MYKHPMFTRLWSDLTTLVLPLAAIVVYVFDASSPFATALLGLALVGIFAPWVAQRGWRSWRDGIARLGATARRGRPPRRGT